MGIEYILLLTFSFVLIVIYLVFKKLYGKGMRIEKNSIPNEFKALDDIIKRLEELNNKLKR